MTTADGRECTKCNLFKIWDKFPVNSKGKNGRKSVCSECTNAAQRAYCKRMSEANPEQWSQWRREKHLKSFYGLLPEEYELMVVQHNNCCAICKKEPDKLFIDHCHTNGHVRGLLCQHCNTLLGMAKDSVVILQGAVKYLEKDYG